MSDLKRKTEDDLTTQTVDDTQPQKKQKVDTTTNTTTTQTEQKEENKNQSKTDTEIVNEFLASTPIPPEDFHLDDSRTPSEVYGLVMRQEIYLTRPFDEVQLVEFNNINCVMAPVIISFPSNGLVGILTGKQIVKTLKLPLIGIIKINQFQVGCVVSHEQPTYPARFYGNQHCVVFICEMSLHIIPNIAKNLVQCILDFGHRHRAPMIYVLEGLPKPNLVQLPTGEEVEICLDEEEQSGTENNATLDMLVDDSVLTKMIVREIQKNKVSEENEESKKEEKQSSTVNQTQKKKGKSGKKDRKKSVQEGEEERSRVSKLADKLFGDKIHYVTTSHDLARTLRKIGHIPVVDGIIPGIAGGLLAEAPLKTNDVTALLSPTSTVFPDPDASILVLKLLNLLIPNIGLDKTATELEKDVASLKKMMKGLMQNLTSGVNLRRSSGAPPGGMYQ